MKKQTILKIISKLIVFVFIVSFFQFALPIHAAENKSMYSNPNQNSSKNPYKFKVSDVVSSGLLTSVIGCTGVVNKVATWMSSMVQSPAKILEMAKAESEKIKEQLIATCAAIKGAAELAGQIIPSIGGTAKPVGTAFENEEYCRSQMLSMDDKALAKAVEEEKARMVRDYKEQCFDGIAITLAKNQLTAMTRSAMNWVNSGYGGNPFFVQNMQRLTYNLEKNVIETGANILLSPQNANPYATDFIRTKINNQGIISSSAKFLGGLQSDLGNFIADPDSYYSKDQLKDANKTRTALQNAQNANNAFARNFSLGGWNGWLALTQREQNNPLGFNMIASQYINEMQNEVVTETRRELGENSGFLSQKVCTLYNDKELVDLKKILSTSKSIANDLCTAYGKDDIECTNANEEVARDQSKIDNFKRECTPEGWKIVTPGSMIKEKTANYLNSPERQLELVKTINDSLNALFSVLISKLESNGLSGLSDSAVNTNWTDNMNTLTDESSGNTTRSSYDNNGAYNNFNLTRDLGNTYLHGTANGYGSWNAKENWTTTSNGLNNNKKLYPNLNPEIYDAKTGDPILTNNAFYTVDTAGKTRLIFEGHNDWQVGDRAFWNGSEWQNWKCAANAKGECTNQKSPIEKRGVIQIQEDYIVAAKEIVSILPNILTKLGELDYCIPGPNPSYKTNSTDAQSAYQDWIGSIYVGPVDEFRQSFTIDQPRQRTYDKLASIHSGNPGVWKLIKDSMSYLLNEFNGYNYMNGKWFSGQNAEEEELKEKKILMTVTQNFVNNSLFQNFYEIFDKAMDSIYFKNMTSVYKESELTSINKETDKNPAYIPMAESGLDFTKNIIYYNDDITQTTKDYNDAIAQAKVNIAKLKPIRDEVSGIIQAAQERRKVALDKLINQPNEKAILECKEKQNNCLKGYSSESVASNNTCLGVYNTCIKEKTSSGEMKPEAELQALYKECLLEEDIKVYDADGIIGMGSPDEERCTDGFDNDFDGLVDSKDPDCPQTNVSTNYKCISINDHIVQVKLSDANCNGGNSNCFGKLATNKYNRNACEGRSQTSCSKTEYRYAGPTFYPRLLFNSHNEWKVKSCVWANVRPQY